MIKPPYRNKIGVHVDLFLDIVPTSKGNDMSWITFVLTGAVWGS